MAKLCNRRIAGPPSSTAKLNPRCTDRRLVDISVWLAARNNRDAGRSPSNVDLLERAADSNPDLLEWAADSNPDETPDLG